MVSQYYIGFITKRLGESLVALCPATKFEGEFRIWESSLIVAPVEPSCLPSTEVTISFPSWSMPIPTERILLTGIATG